MQNIGLGLISIFIAVAIFIIDKDNAKELDRKIILNQVINIKKVATNLVTLFAPLFFWDMSPIFCRLIIIVIFLYSFCEICKSLIRAYQWISTLEPGSSSPEDNFRLLLRLKYFESIGDDKQKKFEWDYFWSNCSGSTPREIEKYLLVFSNNVDKTIKNNDFQTASYLISGIMKSIDNLPLNDLLVYEIILKNTLSWVKKSYIKEKQNKTNKFGDVFYLESTSENLLKILIGQMSKLGLEFIFFDTTKKHLDQNSKRQKYIGKIIQLFSLTVFNLKKDNLYSTLSNYFPEEWKIRLNTFMDNAVQRYLLRDYLDWAQKKIWDSDNNREDNFDSSLEEVTYQLFPEIDPPTWASWLTFLIKPYSEGNRVSDYIETRRIFGFASRPFSTVGPHSDEELNRMVLNEISKQRELTLKMLLSIFSNQLSISNLERYQSEAIKIHYEDESKLHKKNRFLAEIKVLIKIQKNTNDSK